MTSWLVSSLYIAVLGSLIGILLRYYFYVIIPFSKIPSVRQGIFLIEWLFSKEKITSYIFQKLIFFANLYQNEGLFVGWTFKPYLIIFNKEDIKNVLNNNINKSSEYKMFHDAFGISLLTSDEVLWRKRRKLLNPLFTTKMLMDKMPIYNMYSEKIVHELTEMQLKGFVDVEKLLKRFSFNIIYEALTGISLNNIFKPERELIIELVDRYVVFVNQRLIKPWLYFGTLFAEGRAFQKDMKKLNEIIRKHLMKMKDTELECRVRPYEDNTESIELNKSFVEVLFDHHDKNPDFTMEDVINEFKLFLSGGYDTISSALNCILFLLGKHPRVQDRVYEEMATLEGDMSLDDLQHLPYMECVIMETLRLYPPVPIIARHLNKEMQCGKYRIPKDTTAVILVYMYHRNPKVFLNPDKFDPDRFLNGNSLENQWTNFAFSTGKRNCIGQRFAMLEMKTALVHILRKFKIVSHGEIEENKFGWELLLNMGRPLLMKFLPRQDMLRE